jgi:hypothetical protein
VTDAGADALGWALVLVPYVAGITEIAAPPELGLVVSLSGLLATVVLIGVDAARFRQQGARHVVPAFLLWLVFYPLYMHRRRAWGGKNRLLLALGAVVVFMGAGFVRPLAEYLFAEPNQAHVKCVASGKTLGEGYDCTVTRPSGKRTVRVCWDLQLVCSDVTAHGHACETAGPGATVTTHLPYEYFGFGPGDCTKLTSAAVTNLEITRWE